MTGIAEGPSEGIESNGGESRAAGALPTSCVVAMGLCLVLFVVAQYGRLGQPLLWQDEGETAMFGRRVLEFGYPKVHGAEGVVYGMSVPMRFAVDAESDAYTGSLWGQYYFAAFAVGLSDLATGASTRTALVRLPFALAGTAGLALVWLAYAPAFGPPRRRFGFFCAWWVGLACSVSLLLHLREVRYYALVMLLVGFALWLRQRARGWTRRVGLALAFFALFNVFYPAAVALAVWLVFEGVWPLRHSEARSPGAIRAAALEWAPLVAAAVALVPVVLWFRVLPLSELMSARYQFGLTDYATNVAVVARHLAEHEWLVAAGLLRVAAWQLARGVEGPALAASLWRLVAVWVAIGARNPIFFERYFVALGPLLLMAALLDFDRVLRDAVTRGRGMRFAVSIAAVCVVGSLLLKAPALAGRVTELITPVRGPLDVAIEWVDARASGAAPPVVATNYEAEVWMFYLGAPVVGRFHADTEAAARDEAAVRADFVVPRKGYPHTVERLRVYLEPGAFERHVLEIADLPYNTIPELSSGRVLARTHPFRTVSPAHEGEALEIWQRLSLETSP